MKNLVILVLFFNLIGCKTNEDIVGTYSSHYPSLPGRVLKSYFGPYDGFAVGTLLELRSDSTFTFETCGNIITGSWNANKDSIYLTYLTHRYRSDSLQKHGYNGLWPKTPERPILYLIENNKIDLNYTADSEQKGLTIYRTLHKEKNMP